MLLFYSGTMTFIQVTSVSDYREPSVPMDIDDDYSSISSMDVDDDSVVSMDTDEEMEDALADVDDIIERFQRLEIKTSFFESFFGNVSIDEKGRAVRRSPRLHSSGSIQGSYYAPSNDGRTLRRSCRIARAA